MAEFILEEHFDTSADQTCNSERKQLCGLGELALQNAVTLRKVTRMGFKGDIYSQIML